MTSYDRRIIMMKKIILLLCLSQVTVQSWAESLSEFSPVGAEEVRRLDAARQRQAQAEQEPLAELKRQRQAEARAWSEAVRADTESGYRDYLAGCSLCTHRAEAEQALERLAEAEEAEALYSGEMVSIPGGTFRMGDLSGVSWWGAEKPVHRVTMPAFKLGKYEVTFAQWDACVADGGCGGYTPDDEGWGRGKRPVIHVSWSDAQAFIDWLNGKTGGGYRLPSEAEWEYAVRAGSTTKYGWGDEIGSNRANCDGCGSRWDGERTAPVGSFPANAWGLHDMHGNVWEWVADCWNGSYRGAPTDGSAWMSGDCGQRVVRGGSAGLEPWYLRSAVRGRFTRTYRSLGRGFRLAQSACCPE